MSTSIYIDHTVFNLLPDSDLILGTLPYDQIKKEINKNNSISEGVTDWGYVKNKCISLADRPGIDMLLCCYYAVAVTKQQGLSGLANGLELIASSITISNCNKKMAKKQKEIIEWTNELIIREIKLLRPTYEKLRELHRCEHLCEKIDEIFSFKQPEIIGLMDNLAYVIFEHVDRLEIKHQTHEKLIEEKVVYKKKFNYFSLICMFVFAFFLSGSIFYFYQNMKFEPEDYLHGDNQKTLTKRDIRQLNDYISKNSSLSLAWLGSTHQQQGVSLAKLESVLKYNKKVSQLRKEWLSDKQQGIKSVDVMVDKFKTIRNRLSNINLKIQQSDMFSVKEYMGSVVKVGNSLSPIYARISYIETLLDKGDKNKASKEINELNKRLSAVSWKVIQLEKQLKMIP